MRGDGGGGRGRRRRRGGGGGGGVDGPINPPLEAVNKEYCTHTHSLYIRGEKLRTNFN